MAINESLLILWSRDFMKMAKVSLSSLNEVRKVNSTEEMHENKHFSQKGKMGNLYILR